MKELLPEYFTHNYAARNDPKQIDVKMKMGLEGIGIYWQFVEYLYEQQGSIKTEDLPKAAFSLQCSLEKLKDLVENYSLFVIKNGILTSSGIQKRLRQREEKSQKAKKSADVRWHDSDDTDVMRTHSDGNALKDSKGKDRKEDKEKNIKERIVKERETAETSTPASAFDNQVKIKTLAAQLIKTIPKDDESFETKRQRAVRQVETLMAAEVAAEKLN